MYIEAIKGASLQKDTYIARGFTFNGLSNFRGQFYLRGGGLFYSRGLWWGELYPRDTCEMQDLDIVDLLHAKNYLNLFFFSIMK